MRRLIDGSEYIGQRKAQCHTNDIRQDNEVNSRKILGGVDGPLTKAPYA